MPEYEASGSSRPRVCPHAVGGAPMMFPHVQPHSKRVVVYAERP